MVTAEAFETRRFTADEVLRMVEVGVLGEDEPVELLEGRLVVVSPQGPTHVKLTVIIRQLLESRYGGAYHLQDHSPVLGLPDSLPEPDLAVVRGQPTDNMERLAGAADVPLVVEIGVSAVPLARRKAAVYAAAGFGTYWIVDVGARRLEVRDGPATDGTYANLTVFDDDATVALPEVRGAVGVRALLP